MKLILVRHGETTGNSSERYWGATDLALSDTGIGQARRLRRRLSRETIDAVYSSDMQRAVRTAEEITRSRSLEITRCAELNEVDFGSLEGLTIKEIQKQYPEFYQSWLEWNTGLRFPGGESVSDVRMRVSSFTERLKLHSSEDTVLVVAHAGTLRMFICHLLDLPLPFWRKLRLELASVSVIELTAPGAVLTCLNDVSHLDK